MTWEQFKTLSTICVICFVMSLFSKPYNELLSGLTMDLGLIVFGVIIGGIVFDKVINTELEI